MNFEVKIVDNIHIIYLPSSLDIQASQDFRALLDDIIWNFPKSNILLNLKNVQYINSTNIGEIFRALKFVKGGKRIAKICNLNSNVKEIFDMVKITSFVDSYYSEKEALDSFSESVAL
ncbi:MAG: STAS domain-containing protein [bacterium]|nr:STAS domain-containing protein [bacterium]